MSTRQGGRIARLFGRHKEINWTLADQALVSASNFLTGLVVARFLGLEAFGIFSIAWLILLFVQSFQIAVIFTPMLSIVPKTLADQRSAYLAALMPLQVLFASGAAVFAGACCLLAGSALGMGSASESLALPLALCVGVTQLQEFMRRYFFSIRQPGAALRIDLVRHISQFALFVYIFGGDHGTVKATLFAVAASASLGVLLNLRLLPATDWRVASLHAAGARHWGMSKWLVPSTVMQWTGGNLFTIAAGAMLGPASVGAMRAARNLLAMTNVLFQALDNWAPVRAARILESGGRHGLAQFVKRLLVVCGGATAAVALCLALPAEFWLDLVYGTEYSPYPWLVAVYGAHFVADALVSPYRYAFSAMETTKPIFDGHVLMTIFSVLSVYPLLHYQGLIGAAVGLIAAPMILLIHYHLAFQALLREGSAAA